MLPNPTVVRFLDLRSAQTSIDKIPENTFKERQKQIIYKNSLSISYWGGGEIMELLCVGIAVTVKKGNKMLGITTKGIESRTEDSILLNTSPLCLHKS